MIFIIAWWTLPVFAYAVAKFRTIPPNRFLVIGATMALGYCLLIAAVMAGDVYDSAKMRSFDRNGNGRIDDSERTEEVNLAMREQGGDTGRALAPVLGIPLTAVWYTLLFSVLYGGEWVVMRLSPSPPVVKI